jgi:hypothetical protein
MSERQDFPYPRPQGRIVGALLAAATIAAGLFASGGPVAAQPAGRPLAPRKPVAITDRPVTGPVGVDLASATGTAANAWYGPYTVLNLAYNNCLDADLNTINGNGTKIQLWECNGWHNQQWYFYDLNGQGTAYIIYSRAQVNRILDADLNTINRNGTTVQLWDYISGNANQTWIPTQDSSGHYTFYNNYSFRILDADLNGRGLNGTRVQLWDRNGNLNQLWYLV